MKNFIPPHKLSRELRREARRNRPPHSAQLHDRIMAALPAQATLNARRSTRSQSGMWLMFSAALVVAVVVGLWNLPAASTKLAARDARTVSAVPADREPASVELQTPVDVPAHAVATVAAEPREVTGFEATASLLELAVDPIRAVGHAESAVPTSLMDEQLAMLDHDARVAAAWVLDPLALTLED